MAVAYQASGTLLGALTTNDVTPVIPAHAADDILICVTANRVITNTCATPSGWTLLFGPVDETAWRSYVFWKRAASGAETNPLCDWTATSADKYAQVHTLRGAVTTGDPFAATAWTDGGADPAVATGVTTAVANQYVCSLGLCADNLSTSATVTATDPSSFTVRSHTVIGTGADATGFIYDAVRAAAGATGNVSHDFNAAPLHWGILVAAVTAAPPPPGPTVTITESAWNTTTTPKSVVVSGCLTGDYLFALGGGDQFAPSNDVTAASTSTTAGTTGSWTEILEGLAGNSEDWYSTAWALVTGDGDVTVQMARTMTGTPGNWGFYVVRARGSDGPGNSGATANSATEVVSLAVSQDSAVAFASFDWDAAAVGTGWTPTGNVTLVERAVHTQYTAHAAYWLGQAAGTRDYGSTGASGANIKCVAIEMLAEATGTNAPAEAATATALAGDAQSSVAPAAEHAAATAAALDATATTGVAAPAATAAATAAAQDVQASVASRAESAAVSAAGQDATVATAVLAAAETATVSAAAQDATVSTATATNAAAETAGATAVAQDAQASIQAPGGTATATATAHDALVTVAVAAPAQTATATATGHDAQAGIGASAETAAASAVAHDATVNTTGATNALAEAASATAAAQDPQAAIGASAESAPASGAAHDATVSTSGATNANAEAATATAAALDATVSTSGTGTASAEAAEATAASLDPQISVRANAEAATATAAALNAAVAFAREAAAQDAAATGAALDAVIAVYVSAGAALGTATAGDATVGGAATGVALPGTAVPPQVRPGSQTGAHARRGVQEPALAMAGSERWDI